MDIVTLECPNCGGNPGKDPLVGTGAVLIIIAIMLFFAGPPMLGYSYPDYDLIYGNTGMGDKTRMWLKLSGLSVGLAVLSAFAAYVVLSILDIV